MEPNQYWIYVCAQGCLAELAAREEDPSIAARYREGLARGADRAHGFMVGCKAYRNDRERPFRYANWREGYHWREQPTQKIAEEVAFSPKKEILGERRGLEFRQVTAPLAAAAICAYAGKYGDEIRRTLAHYDYSTPAISTILYALVAWESLLFACAACS